MSSITQIYLVLVSAVALITLSSAAGVCSGPPYSSLLSLSTYQPAQAYCTSYYPLPTVTVTQTNPKRDHARALPGLAARATTTTRSPAATTTGKCESTCQTWSSVQQNPRTFLATLCSCIETAQTTTPASATQVSSSSKPTDTKLAITTTTTTTAAISTSCPPNDGTVSFQIQSHATNGQTYHWSSGDRGSVFGFSTAANAVSYNLNGEKLQLSSDPSIVLCASDFGSLAGLYGYADIPQGYGVVSVFANMVGGSCRLSMEFGGRRILVVDAGRVNPNGGYNIGITNGTDTSGFAVLDAVNVVY